MHSHKGSLSRAALLVAGVLFIVGFATSPLLRSGLVASDYRALALAERPLMAGSAHRNADAFPGELSSGAMATGEAPTVPPLALLAQKLSLRIAEFGAGSEPGEGPPGAFFLRLEGLFYLALGALGLSLFTRRLLLPWTGSVHAAAAGWASALIFLVHPLASAAVAGVALRGELLAVVLAVWSGAFFLRGRQDRRIGFTITSFVLCGLGGFASNVTLGLPVLLACAEFVSAHRYRTVRGRLRTTMTTLVVFGIAAALYLTLHVSRLGSDSFPILLRALANAAEPDALAGQARRMLEELGLLILPVNPNALGTGGVILAGALFLIAAQPALVAARSAPRLWTMLLIFFVIGLGLTLVLQAGDFAFQGVPQGARVVGSGAVLFSSAAVVAAGIGIASTALSGSRRRLLPWAVALGYGILSHGNALGWRAAGRAAEVMAAELSEVVSVFGTEPLYLVIDPSGPILGVDPFDADLSWLVSPRRVGEDLGAMDSTPRIEGETQGSLRIRGLAAGGLRLFASTPEFRLAREHGLVVLGPRREGEREVWPVRPARPSEAPRSWQNELTSPVLDLDPVEFSVLVAHAQPGAELERLERVGWTTVDGEARASDAGLWLPGAEGPLGIYDLSALPEWVCSERIRRVRFDEGRLPLERVEIRSSLPPVRAGLAPRVDDSAWHFAAPEKGLADLEIEGARWVLALFDMTTMLFVELPAEPASEGARALIVPGAERNARALGSGPTLWSLERRVKGRAFQASTGRRRRPLEH